jgi:hypothetical protein
MDRMLFQLDDTTQRFRRVGRLARRRFRIEGDALSNGTHTDGRVTVTISGLGPAAAGAPDTFDWESDRPIALVIVRAGIDGDDVSFHVGPTSSGQGTGTLVGDGTGIRYVAFCYDAEPDPVTVAVPALPAIPVAARVHTTVVTRERRIAAALGRPSTLARMLRLAPAAASSAA